MEILVSNSLMGLIRPCNDGPTASPWHIASFCFLLNILIARLILDRFILLVRFFYGCEVDSIFLVYYDFYSCLLRCFAPCEFLDSCSLSTPLYFRSFKISKLRGSITYFFLDVLDGGLHISVSFFCFVDM